MKVRAKKLISKIAWELFDLAKDLALFAEEIAFTPYGQLRYHKIPRTTYYRKLEKFEEYGLVKKERKQYGNFYTLTAKAKALRRRPSVKHERLDGLSTVIIFDIPEQKHKVRDTFRRFLIRNGYTQIQKSVFISPYKISEDIKDLVGELGIRPNVTVFGAKIDHNVLNS